MDNQILIFSDAQDVNFALITVVVHGHEQCVICKSNIFECYSGYTCGTDTDLKIGYKRN